MSTSHRRSGVMLLLLLLTVTSGFHRAQPRSAAQGPEWRAQFLAAAQRMSFDAAHAPETDAGIPASAYPSGAPKMTLASAPTRGSGAGGAVSARITSPAAYPRLGIAPGVNYLWTDTIGGVARQLVIPANTAFPVRWLRVAPHPHPSATKGAGLFVVAPDGKVPAGRSAVNLKAYTLGLCAECINRDGTRGWCRGSDTTSVSIASWTSTVAAMTSFFRSSGIKF